MTLIHHVAGRTLWLVLGGMAALAVAWHLEGTQPAPDWTTAGRQEAATDNKYRFDVRALAGQNATLAHRSAALDRDTAQLRRSLHETQGAVENLVHSIDSLHRQPLTAAVRRIGEACGELAQNCEQRVLAAQQRDSLHLAMYQLAAPRLARADSIIAQGLRATQCKVLFLTCPSRTRVAEVFFVLGAGTVLLVRR